MSPPDDALWQRIADHRIGQGDASLTFAARLARENRWSLSHAERVIGEYKRFCYLAVTAGHEVTPPDAVDQAWHLHLTYSRDYWQTFCPQVLEADLHHGPTRGGTAERGRFLGVEADGWVAGRDQARHPDRLYLRPGDDETPHGETPAGRIAPASAGGP